jgi:hypothetical protein
LRASLGSPSTGRSSAARTGPIPRGRVALTGGSAARQCLRNCQQTGDNSCKMNRVGRRWKLRLACLAPPQPSADRLPHRPPRPDGQGTQAFILDKRVSIIYCAPRLIYAHTSDLGLARAISSALSTDTFLRSSEPARRTLMITVCYDRCGAEPSCGLCIALEELNLFQQIWHVPRTIHRSPQNSIIFWGK